MTEVLTFGCRLNALESEALRQGSFAEAGDNAVIVNTCAVTAEAERQARQAIRRLRRERPGVRILVTGCAAEIAPASYAAMPEVDGVISNSRKAEMADKDGALPAVLRDARDGAMQRAFVQVQNGCDHRCTFCIIPFGRGASRSLPQETVVARCRAAVEQGFNEVVLTGVDIASYGRDHGEGSSLGHIAARVLREVPELPRLRLSSLDPAAIDPELWRLIGNEPRLMPHLHLSLQAGDDMILKRMKRRHTRGDVLALCARARSLRPGLAFGADVIAGFPTEDATMFENTLRLVDEGDIAWLHVFPYSARKGTPAARMPQVDASLRRERAERLRAAGDRAAARHMAGLQGQTVEVLVERQGLGCTPHFAKIPLKGQAAPGSLVMVECVECGQGPTGGVMGKIIENTQRRNMKDVHA